MLGARIYHTWKARNWKHFIGINENTEIVIAEIKKEILERIDYIKGSRKPKKCSSIVKKTL